MSTIKVIDNFLDDETFTNFATLCMTYPHFGCADFATNNKDADGSIERFGEDLDTNVSPEVMFQAMMLKREAGLVQITDFYLASRFFIDKLQEKLNALKFYVLRLNCTVRQPRTYTGMMHTDSHLRNEKFKNAILYLNTNNGGTRFEDGTFVQSKKNRCVIAPVEMKHAGVWHTDAKLRFVLNINYIEN